MGIWYLLLWLESTHIRHSIVGIRTYAHPSRVQILKFHRFSCRWCEFSIQFQLNLVFCQWYHGSFALAAHPNLVSINSIWKFVHDFSLSDTHSQIAIHLLTNVLLSPFRLCFAWVLNSRMRCGQFNSSLHIHESFHFTKYSNWILNIFHVSIYLHVALTVSQKNI